MKINLVIIRWFDPQDNALLNDELNGVIPLDEFPEGQTIVADLDLSEDTTAIMKNALASGFSPALYISPDTPEFRWKKSSLTEIDAEAMAGLAAARAIVDTTELETFVDELESRYLETSRSYLRLAAGLKALKTASKKQTCLQLERYMEYVKHAKQVVSALNEFQGNGEGFDA